MLNVGWEPLKLIFVCNFKKFYRNQKILLLIIHGFLFWVPWQVWHSEHGWMGLEGARFHWRGIAWRSSTGGGGGSQGLHWHTGTNNMI